MIENEFDFAKLSTPEEKTPKMTELTDIPAQTPDTPLTKKRPLPGLQENPTPPSNPYLPKLVTIIDTGHVKEELTSSFRKEMAEARTWKATGERLIGRIKSVFQRDLKTETFTPIDYAQTTNYSNLFPYESSYAGDLYWKLITDVIDKYTILSTDKPRLVVEFGCATGNLLEVLDSRNTNNRNIKLVGIDISEESLKIAAQRVPVAKLLKADLNRDGINEAIRKEIGDTKADLIIILDTAEHLDSPQKQDDLMGFIFDSLKPGGYALIGMPEKTVKNEPTIKRLFKYLWNKGDKDPTHYNKPEPKRFIELVKNAGFDIVDDFNYFPIPAPFGGLTKLSFSANRLMVLQKPAINRKSH